MLNKPIDARCYICGAEETVEWHSLWYDGEMRYICSLMCRSKIERLWADNPTKRYRANIKENR